MKTITIKLLKWLKEADEKVRAYERLTKANSGKRIDYNEKEG